MSEKSSKALRAEFREKVERAVAHAEKAGKEYGEAIPEGTAADERWMHVCALYVYLEEWMLNCNEPSAIESMITLFREPYDRARSEALAVVKPKIIRA